MELNPLASYLHDAKFIKKDDHDSVRSYLIQIMIIHLVIALFYRKITTYLSVSYLVFTMLLYLTYV